MARRDPSAPFPFPPFFFPEHFRGTPFPRARAFHLRSSLGRPYFRPFSLFFPRSFFVFPGSSAIDPTLTPLASDSWPHPSFLPFTGPLFLVWDRQGRGPCAGTFSLQVSASSPLAPTPFADSEGGSPPSIWPQTLFFFFSSPFFFHVFPWTVGSGRPWKNTQVHLLLSDLQCGVAVFFFLCTPSPP